MNSFFLLLIVLDCLLSESRPIANILLTFIVILLLLASLHLASVLQVHRRML